MFYFLVSVYGPNSTMCSVFHVETVCGIVTLSIYAFPFDSVGE